MFFLERSKKTMERPKNVIYRTSEEKDGSFEIIGEPDFRQKTATFVSQDIQFDYRTEAETGIPLWTVAHSGSVPIAPYAAANGAFIPFGTKFDATETLPLNSTFENIRWRPAGLDYDVRVENRELLELRQLVTRRRCRLALEQVDLPSEENLSGYNWTLSGQPVSYTEVKNSITNNGETDVYSVEVPICRFGRVVVGSNDRFGFGASPLIHNNTMRSITFTFDWTDGKFKFPGKTITMNTDDFAYAATFQGNFHAHRDINLYIPALETTAVNAAGYCVFGPDNHNTIVANRTYGWVAVPLRSNAPNGEWVQDQLAVEIDDGGLGVQVEHRIQEFFRDDSRWIAIGYFQIPFGRREKIISPPILNPIAAAGAAGNYPAVLAHPGILSIRQAGCTPWSYNHNHAAIAGADDAIYHDGIATQIDNVYLRWRATDVGIDFGDGGVTRHSFYVQFPEALPANFEVAANRYFYFRTNLTTGGAIVQSYLTGIRGDAAGHAAHNWHILNAAALAQYNLDNNAANIILADSRPPPAVAGSVIILYVIRQVINAPRRALPASDMVDHGVPQTPIAEFTIAGAVGPPVVRVQTEHNILGSVLLESTPQNIPPYIRSSFTLSQNEPFFNTFSGLSSYRNVSEPFNTPLYCQVPLILLNQ